MIEPSDLIAKHIDEVKCLVAEFSLDFEEVTDVTVRVKLWKSSKSYGGDNYTYTVSHHIHTPTQIGPYYPSALFAKSEEGLARKALTDILLFYSGAIREGHTPSAKWFVPNESFS